MGFYSRAKQGLTDAGLDLLDLARGFERSYQDGSFTPVKEAAARYLDTEHAGTVLMAAPLAAGGLVAGIDPALLGLSGVGAAVAAPYTGKVFYRGEMGDIEEAEAKYQREIDRIDGTLKARQSEPKSKYSPTISEEEIADLGKRKAYLEGTELPNLGRRKAGIRNKQRALGGGATAAVLAAAALINRAEQETTQEPTLSDVMRGAGGQPQVSQPVLEGILNLNADFSGAPMSVVPPVRDDLLSYWNVG